MTVQVEKKKLTDQNFEDFWYNLEEHKDSENVWSVSPNWVKRTLGILRVFERIAELENRIELLEKPLKKQEILDLLEGQPPHNREWIINRTKNREYWETRPLLEELIQEGKLSSERKGTSQMFSLKKTKA